MADSEISFLTNDGVKIVYEKRGDSTHATLILLHGWSGSKRYFDKNIDALAEVCSVYRLDHRFHGDSDKPSWGFFVSRLAADVHDLIVQCELKNVVLLGTSMGCSIIWAYCMLYGTSSLIGAIFVDQSPLQNRRGDWALGSKGCYDEATLLKTIEDVSDLPTFAESTADACLSIPIDDEYHQLLKNETMKADGKAIGELMRDHTQIDWRPVLPRINIPCLNCIGKKSGIFPSEGVERVGDLIPKCKNVVFPDENHWLHIENPTKFNATVLGFLKELCPGWRAQDA